MEKINLRLTRSLVPPVLYQLTDVKEGKMSYSYYGLRHPGGIFSIQFSDVLAAFNQLAQATNNIQSVGTPCSDEESENLKTLTRTLFFQLVNYFESGYEIFLCFCDRLDKPQPGRPLYRWFTENGYENEVKPYFANINPDLARYRDFFNALKHSSNRLGIFQFMNPQNSRKAMGFYLEGVSENGAIGPVLSLHPKYEGMSTAWSYNLHLRTLYFLIYQIAFEIGEVIQRLCARHNLYLEPPTTPLPFIDLEKLAATAMTNTVSRFESVFNVFYPQEVAEQMKGASFDDKEGSIVFTEKVVGEKAIGPGQTWGVRMTSKGDVFSRSWQLPYFIPRPNNTAP